ncbi:FecR family protein [Tunicatimonas pelagia]|uniref:FecR family protein n=1 Tax=Tunicatimonas pelagia TaxID=931531 RepID=UPI0026667F04|nr:FecR domain-containing protein [Tunicatimonas pelagia]WKN43146.1 FecR domain-containing protein [Tunicatimonas pelagia]
MAPDNPVDPTLLVRYLEDKNQLSPDEQNQIEQWIQQTPQNQEGFEKLRIIWEQANQASIIKKVDAQADWPKVWAKIPSKSKPTPTRQLPFYQQRVWQIAASVALLLISIWGIRTVWHTESPAELATYTLVAQDSIRVINLPDGSQVFLNETAQLSYQEDFGEQNRTVHLTGEGYFEVVSNPAVPFFVHTTPTTVRVVGTSFNVNSADEAVKVTVNSGKVAFSHQRDTLLLTPNEVGIYQPGKAMQESMNNDENYLSWKTDVLRFDDAPLSQVAEDISRHFQASVQLEDEALEQLRFTSVFQQPSLATVLEEISMVLDIQYTQERNQIKFFITNP